MITVRGTAVIRSVEDYDLLRRDKPTLADDLLSGPEWNDELIKVINTATKPPAAISTSDDVTGL